jgi:hypothetical protein
MNDVQTRLAQLFGVAEPVEVLAWSYHYGAPALTPVNSLEELTGKLGCLWIEGGPYVFEVRKYPDGWRSRWSPDQFRHLHGVNEGSYGYQCMHVSVPGLLPYRRLP